MSSSDATPSRQQRISNPSSASSSSQNNLPAMRPSPQRRGPDQSPRPGPGQYPGSSSSQSMQQTPLRTRDTGDMGLGMRVRPGNGNRQPKNQNPNQSPSTHTTPRPKAPGTILPSSSTPQPRPAFRPAVPAAGTPFNRPPGPGSGVPNNLGQFQRTVTQQLDQLTTRMNATANEMLALKQWKQEHENDAQLLKRLHLTVSAQQKEIESLKDKVEDLMIRRSGPVDGADPRAATMISRMVRSAIEFCYGHDTKPPQSYPEGQTWPRQLTADGQPGAELMRWDHTKSYSHDDNIRETGRVLAVLQNPNTRSAIPLPADTPLASIPPFETHADMYRRSVARAFKTFTTTFRQQAAKAWKATGRAETMKDIAELEKMVQRGGGMEVEESIRSKKEYVKAQDELTAKAMPDKVTDHIRIVRSRLQTTVKWMVERRPLSEYSGPAYDVFDYSYGLIPVAPLADESGSTECYWPTREGVYSQLYETIYDTIYQTECPGSKLQGTSAKDDPEISPPAEPLFPTRLTDLHKGPQRWMFCEEWWQAIKPQATRSHARTLAASPCNSCDSRLLARSQSRSAARSHARTLARSLAASLVPLTSFAHEYIYEEGRMRTSYHTCPHLFTLRFTKKQFATLATKQAPRPSTSALQDQRISYPLTLKRKSIQIRSAERIGSQQLGVPPVTHFTTCHRFISLPPSPKDIPVPESPLTPIDSEHYDMPQSREPLEPTNTEPLFNNVSQPIYSAQPPLQEYPALPTHEPQPGMQRTIEKLFNNVYAKLEQLERNRVQDMREVRLEMEGLRRQPIEERMENQGWSRDIHTPPRMPYPMEHNSVPPPIDTKPRFRDVSLAPTNNLYAFTRQPPRTPCVCGGMHWRTDCPHNGKVNNTKITPRANMARTFTPQGVNATPLTQQRWKPNPNQTTPITNTASPAVHVVQTRASKRLHSPPQEDNSVKRQKNDQVNLDIDELQDQFSKLEGFDNGPRIQQDASNGVDLQDFISTTAKPAHRSAKYIIDHYSNGMDKLQEYLDNHRIKSDIVQRHFEVHGRDGEDKEIFERFL
ncbi:hypothetical protein HD553DRAFT_327108 [Filobasidium floriforme]|uniref:uncharacterized protein n=1 Tax=Filobasidium floriforme TaxID=5210 RepID=UPI001E8D36A9|nr:uncharacterized protein HD553DRAFT_327108 [Filobasidium floriforme]KAH8077776.1 hypothetical protein HD553DRAFT_327108 [Filobasidium floriforme]